MKFNELFTKYFSKLITKDIKYRIMKVVWPIVENMVHWFDSSKAEMSQDDWMYLCNHLKKGDVLLSTKTTSPSNMILPGKAKHAAMVISGDPEKPMLVEALTPEVRKTSLFDFLKGKGYIVHCRAKAFAPEVASAASRIAEKMEGTKYDHVWSPDNNWIYCSELVYESYKIAWGDSIGREGNVFPLTMKVRCGDPTYIPDDIRLDSENWDLLWSNTN